MATKNLARTVTEGGRSGRWAERYSTRVERQRVRRYLDRIDNADEALDLGVGPERRNDWWGTSFSDRLQPVRRFLAARAGQPWDDVFSELCSKFDRRTIKGWHLVDSHVLRHMVAVPRGVSSLWPWVVYPPRSGAWVDERGVLRYLQRKRG